MDVEKGKAARELTDMITRNKSQTHKPLKALEVGDLCFRREFDGKKLVKIDSLCEVIEVRKRNESYYIRDLQTERTYLRNRQWIEPCDEATNEIHKAKLMRVICDQTTCHRINNGSVDKTKIRFQSRARGMKTQNHQENVLNLTTRSCWPAVN